jgi:hypothetical protein
VSDHPYLPAGYNADDWDGDEIDGAGTNWAIWPVLFDAYIGHSPVVITSDMLAVFDEACPDFVPEYAKSTVVFPAVDRSINVTANGWTTISFAYQNNVIVFKPTPGRTVVSDDWGGEPLPVQDNRVVLRGRASVVKPRKS